MVEYVLDTCRATLTWLHPLENEETPMATNVPAHITGTVWKIEVKVGDTVEEGQVVDILESMKMEMPVEAPCAGKVASIATAEGQAVDEGATLVVLE